MSQDIIRIGNAGGYWGDDPEALERQVNGGRLDFITMDFLAEITMSIMQKQKARDPALGYARDFLPMLKKVLPKILDQGTKIITNAGGISPASCARAIEALGQSLDLNPRIAVVYGDDILDQIPALESGGADFTNMETGEPFSAVRDRLLSANIYFGVAPVAEALQWDPNVIITGRVTDTGITIAPMVHSFGWQLDDWDKLAAGVVAGHILECGAQATGGNFTDWHKVPSFTNLGFPIVEVEPDGSFTVTKHPGTGGLVSVDTVREQLFYEMGHPRAYITPDVIADFTSIRLQADGPNRVRVSGIRGEAPTPLYKVSMAYGDGYKAGGNIVISEPSAREKAEKFAGIFWDRCGHLFPDEDRETEYFGWNALHRSLGHTDRANEIMLRLSVRTPDTEKIRIFGKLIPSLILSGPAGVTATGGVPRPQEVVSYWPALLPKKMVQPRIARLQNGTLVDEKEVTTTPTGDFVVPDSEVQTADQVVESLAELHQEHATPGHLPLGRIALARSGDKGDSSNIGIMARSPEAWEFLGTFLTAQKIKDMFQELCKGRVVRHALPNLLGFNFLLDEALGGGGTKTLRTDAQGKTFSQAVLTQKVKIPPEVLAEVDALEKNNTPG